MTEEFQFIGVSTEGSSIMQLFPHWASSLGLDASMRGIDISPGAPADVYRTAVEEIRQGSHVRGALITTHKVAVFESASDLFDEFDRYALACREISCVSKQGARLVGHAKDPITAGIALNHILSSNYWERRNSDVLCLGAGGAGTAIGVALLERLDAPRRIIFTDINAKRIEEVKVIHSEFEARCPTEYHLVASPSDSDLLVADLPSESVLINATGLGKDVPGSPISENVTFPRGTVVWELNYRGDLLFLKQALRQKSRQGLKVEAGWRYFLSSWIAVISEVFDVAMTDQMVERLSVEAEIIRPSAAVEPSAPMDRLI